MDKDMSRTPCQKEGVKSTIVRDNLLDHNTFQVVIMLELNFYQTLYVYRNSNSIKKVEGKLNS